jgi:putative SOS response-associated peptidase YedK
MCGRYVLPDEESVAESWQIACGRCRGWFKPLYNVAPTAQVPVIVQTKDNGLELLGARWGLIPGWWQKDVPPARTFNARSEDAAHKPVWRESLRSARCLMPARGWYEWNENQPAQGKAGRKVKQPFFICCPGAKVIAFAGLWSVWERPGSEAVVSCALLTKPAAPSLAGIHHRMPVVLRPEQQAPWLDTATAADAIQAIIAAAREDLEGFPVSTQVNDVQNDFPELLEKVRVHAMDSLNFDSPNLP